MWEVPGKGNVPGCCSLSWVPVYCLDLSVSGCGVGKVAATPLFHRSTLHVSGSKLLACLGPLLAIDRSRNELGLISPLLAQGESYFQVTVSVICQKPDLYVYTYLFIFHLVPQRLR